VSQKFKCAACGGEFTQANQEEVVVRESELLWPGISPEARIELCDPCFQLFMVWAEAEGLVGVPISEGIAKLQAKGRPI
jgi:hypothetical protein